MNKDNIISWSNDYFLSWDDFQAELNPAIFEDAYSTIKYRYTWTVNSINFKNQIVYFIENIKLISEFHRHLSWVRKSQANSDLLKHEQGHFDLAESLIPEITFQLEKTFNEKKFPTKGQNQEQGKQFAREDSAFLISKEFEKWEKYLIEKQQEYNMETNYGKNLSKQHEYDKIFSKLR